MEKGGKLFVIFFLTSLLTFFIIPPAPAASFFSEDQNSLLLMSKQGLFFESLDQINSLSQKQEFLNKTIKYEYGKFRPQIRKGEELKNYFKKLDLQGDYVYTLLQFEDNFGKGGFNRPRI